MWNFVVVVVAIFKVKVTVRSRSYLNMTFSTISTELLIGFQPNLVCSTASEAGMSCEKLYYCV